jgi:succinate dehydrogenase / fumarate reductase iron-sulfur subunit
MAAKLGHLGLLPQGQAERDKRVLSMVRSTRSRGFGSCSHHYECEAACPKQISIDFIARMNRDYVKAALTYAEPQAKGGEG